MSVVEETWVCPDCGSDKVDERIMWWSPVNKKAGVPEDGGELAELYPDHYYCYGCGTNPADLITKTDYIKDNGGLNSAYQI